MTMRSGLQPGVLPVHRLVGWWGNARYLVGCEGRDGWFGLRWMTWLQHCILLIAGLVVGRCCWPISPWFVTNVLMVCESSRWHFAGVVGRRSTWKAFGLRGSSR